ncbi:MAG: IPTL-CTERM sorting domain-containing protein [Acidovorax sp.]|nr:IPTL-CTERM sorting domain-containing protein [Acidovorax sp.]
MNVYQSLLVSVGLVLSLSSHAQSIKVTPVTVTTFGNVTVGSSATLQFDITDPTFPAPGNNQYLRTLVQSTDAFDLFGATPAPGFTLNLGTCVPAVGVAGTPLNDTTGCRFSITFAPSAPGAASTFIVATNEPSGIWDNTVQLTGTGVAVPVVPVAATSIPTLSEWGMLFMSALLGLFAVMRLRRR